MELVAIGCSSGGLQALQVLLHNLAPCPLTAFALVIHTASADSDALCHLLARHAPMPVREAEERMPTNPGVLHVAPPGYHLLIGSDRHFSLTVDPKVCFVRPSVDVLFESAADAYRDRMAGVILTGANDDGARGLRRVRQLGGVALVQDPEEAESSTMPQAALSIAGADYCMPLVDIANELNRMCLP